MITRQLPLELMRPPTGKCLGAVFCTYRFDEHFFNSVLAALLPIHADPESDTRMFLAEARRRLRETPVVVLADGLSYTGGHRLPFHLVLSPLKTAFHARMALLLFNDHARLIAGSANLKETGFGESADLCGVLHLDYSKDAKLLGDTLAVLERAGAEGEGWVRFARQCTAMLKPARKAPSVPRLIASLPEASVIEQFLAGIPKGAKVEAVHLMAPAQPEDDACSGTRVLAPISAWLAKRAKKAPLNIAVAWEDSSVAPPATRAITDPEQLAGYMCAEIQGPPGAETVAWSPVTKVEKSFVHLATHCQPLARNAVAAVMRAEPPRFWAVEEVTGAGLLEALEPLSEAYDVTWWLFPETRLHKGQVSRRPLHARFLAVCTTERGKRITHLLLGCPNYDRVQTPDESRFEIGLYLCLGGHCSMSDLCSELVPVPSQGFYLEDRAWPQPEGRVPAPLEHATYDAKTHALVLDWQPRAPECRVTYLRDHGEEELIKGRPSLRTSLPGFVLGHESAELRVSWGERQVLVPILVQNVSSVRADEPEDELGFGGLIAYHSSQRRATRARGSHSSRDVFEVEHDLALALAATGSLWDAFEVAMDGPVGLRAFVETLLESEDCDRSQAWLYGLELCRQLANIDWSDDPFRAEKKRGIDTFVTELHVRLRALAPDAPWKPDVAKFYGGRP